MTENELKSAIDKCSLANSTKEKMWENISTNSKKHIRIVPKVLKVAIIVVAILIVIVPATSYAAYKAGIVDDIIRLFDPKWSNYIDNYIDNANRLDRFDGFELETVDETTSDTPFIDPYESTYRFYNEERDIELYTNNDSYVVINYHGETLKVKGSFAFITAVGDHSDIVFSDINKDGEDELIINTVYGGTGYNGSYMYIVNLNTMKVYEPEFENKPEYNMTFDPLEIIKIDEQKYVIGKLTDTDGTSKYLRLTTDYSVFDASKFTLTMGAMYPTVDYGSTEVYYKILYYVDGYSFWTMPVAQKQCQLIYDEKKDRYVNGELISTSFGGNWLEVSPDNYYSLPYYMMLKSSLEGQNVEVSEVTENGNEIYRLYDKETGAEYLFNETENDLTATYNGITTTVYGRCSDGVTLKDITGDGIRDLIYDLPSYVIYNPVTGNTYYYSEIVDKLIDQIKIANPHITSENDNMYYEADFELPYGDTTSLKLLLESNLSNDSVLHLSDFTLDYDFLSFIGDDNNHLIDEELVYDQQKIIYNLKVYINHTNSMYQYLSCRAEFVYDNESDSFLPTDNVEWEFIQK